MPIVAVPSEEEGGLNDSLKLRFGKCKSITFVSIEEGSIDSIRVIPIYTTEVIGNLGIHVAEIMKQNKTSDVIIGYIGKKAFQALNSQNIKIFQAHEDEVTIKKCVNMYIQGKLSEIMESNAHLIKE
ncbi:MAG: NifB/NifX family molybdenum-iron cluster-binding protein [Promethearchaeota archaeon]|jgi:predicted Fe-Mo cluster-binding NifX family protein